MMLNYYYVLGAFFFAANYEKVARRLVSQLPVNVVVFDCMVFAVNTEILNLNSLTTSDENS